MSSRSPVRSVVVGEGTNPWPSRTIRAMLAWAGSRSSKISTPCSRDPGGIWTCSRSACSASSGAASTSTSSGSAGAVTFSRRAAHGSVGPCSRGVDHDDDEHDVEQPGGAGHAGVHRDGGQHDRDRAAQPGPGQERLLPPGHPQRQRRGEHRGGPGRQHQHRPARLWPG